MRADVAEQIERLETLIKHCLKTAKQALLFFLALLFCGALNDLYLVASHQPTWYPYLSNIPFVAGLLWYTRVMWRNFRDWTFFHQARFHMTLAGNALTSSAMDHHLEQADAALARIKVSMPHP